MDIRDAESDKEGSSSSSSSSSSPSSSSSSGFPDDGNGAKDSKGRAGMASSMSYLGREIAAGITRRGDITEMYYPARVARVCTKS